MAIKDENVLGLIENISKVLNVILFTGLGIDVNDYDEFEEMVEFKLELKKYIKENNFKKAQEKLFLEIENKNSSQAVLRVGVWFYLKLNCLCDSELKKGNFVKDDIVYGMKKIEEIAICAGV